VQYTFTFFINQSYQVALISSSIYGWPATFDVHTTNLAYVSSKLLMYSDIYSNLIA